ncbi:MAG: hypothetical protein A2W18_13790 [Candidatus Muproteobacteria bacterium RBG_16_60_9]|uniref:DUF2249 domain-containing protein n=1 Tax=Candidatus Muproteobacteria bacterium RBG_16_60_9 TaxID=1817755 RepID=A0A1F6VHH1_9PROT|nr:MAG: hypothetical protein A2W18_13790 [Candidatus Muproteobacteria bacterium RBG_16_60_9]
MPERVLDVSDLPPPEPLEQVTAALGNLAPGDYLRILHRREPLLLYPWLEEHGFVWSTQPGETTSFEIFIWRRSEEQPTIVATPVLKRT